jgi:hypothetical protein
MRAIVSITPSEPAASGRPRLAQAAQIGTPDGLSQPGRFLVSVGSSQGTEVNPGGRPAAVFLAQLIATAQQAPQTRRRRRAEPNEVSTIYTAASVPAARMGRTICRST